MLTSALFSVLVAASPSAAPTSQCTAAPGFVKSCTVDSVRYDVLPRGAEVAKPGARCRASSSVLGTTNVDGSGPATTVVNIWHLATGNSPNAGYLIKARDGTYWYESPVGFAYQQVHANDVNALPDKHVSITACFQTDLRM